LHGISITVNDDEVVAIVGPNGAGKSTLVKAMFGLLPVVRGTVTFAGSSLAEVKAFQRRGLGMALVPQDGGTFPDLTVEDNLKTSYSALGEADAREALEQAYHMFPVLLDRGRQRARTLSGGERQMLSFVAGIGGKPQFLALDEPTTGLAPTIVRELTERIVQFKEGGSAILWVVGENPLEVLPYADRVYVIAAGKIRAAMSARELLGDQALRDLFFGSGARP
jgi:branched-chain amino acid transport system ATP-binding protein